MNSVHYTAMCALHSLHSLVLEGRVEEDRKGGKEREREREREKEKERRREGEGEGASACTL